jgi:cell division protein FtsB
MSNAAYAPRNVRAVVGDIQALRRRANLRVVRPGARRAGTVPFLMTIGVMLLGGLVGLLMFNTSMQNVAFQQNALQAEATNLAAQQQSLDLQLSNLNNPQHIAQSARALGMVIPPTVAFIRIPSGQVLGTPTPANGSATPNLFAPNPMPYYPPVAPPKATTITPRTVAKTPTKTATTTTTKKPATHH